MPRPSKLPFNDVARWATESVAAHPTDFTQALAARFGVTRAGAASTVQRLAAEGYIVKTGASTRPHFAAGPVRWLSRRYKLPGIDEQLLWDRDFRPWIDASANVTNILHHGFTEIVNNANDHSGGTHVQVDFQARKHSLGIIVTDDGVGIFERIARTLKLPDPRLSLLELSKGKFTSDRQHHSGEGIFFTSRMFDEFYLDANQLGYSKFNIEDERERLESQDFRLVDHEGQPIGTGVMMFISRASRRTARDVFERFTPDVPDDYSFSKTVVPVKLASLGTENLLSRSQAKRLVARIDQFKTVELDFSDVSEIGQAFADEVFRVFASAHPQVTLIPVNANAYVQGMIQRVRRA